MIGPDLPHLTDPARATRVALGQQTRRTSLELLPGTVHSVGRWRFTDDGEVEGQRRDVLGPHWHRLTPTREYGGPLVRDWCREMRIGQDPTDPYTPRPTEDPDVAEQIADEVAALVRAAPTGTPPLPTLTPAAALARQLTRTRELVADGDTLRWRLRVRDPVHGTVGRDPGAPEPGGDRAPAGLLARLRPDPHADTEPVTAATVDAVVRHGGYLQPHAERPDPADVVTELRRMAGLP